MMNTKEQKNSRKGKYLNMEQSLIKGNELLKTWQITYEEIIEDCYLKIITRFKRDGCEFISENYIRSVISRLKNKKHNNLEFYGVEIPLSYKILCDENLFRNTKEKIIVENFVKAFISLKFDKNYKKERNIIMLLQYFGLLENKGSSTKEISDEYGISQTAVRLIIENIIRRFRFGYFIDCYAGFKYF